MKKSIKFLIVALVIALPASALGYYYYLKQASSTHSTNTPNIFSLHVYKTPTCGCCTKWLEHLEKENLKVTYEDVQNVEPVKQRNAISQQYWSCHTGLSEEGYAFEGHVPAKFVRQFLANPEPNSIGLSVPAMPVGSPGMEYKEQFMPYQVLLLKKDGSSEVYAEITNYEEQF
jgi:hypothetical protein